MGADLYIRSQYNANHAKYEHLFEKAVSERNSATDAVVKEEKQKEVSKLYNKMYSKGYYRDSYNDTNLLWVLGLDYWNHVQKMLDKEGNLTPDKAAELLKEIKRYEHKCEREYIKKDWQKYFKNKHKKLCEFLEKAIALNESIDCSV